MQKNKKKAFLSMLNADFQRRFHENPSYSLRQYARFLGLESSHLSKFMRAMRLPSSAVILKIGRKIEIDENILSYLISKNILGTKEVYKTIDSKYFQMIADPLPSQILELMKFDDFKPSIKYISEKLSLKPTDAKNAVQLLQDAGYLEIVNPFLWVDKTDGARTFALSDQETSQAKKESQKNILDKAQIALLTTPFNLRDNSSMIVASNAQKIKKAKEKIKKFRRELSLFLEKCDQKNEIYFLSVSLFPSIKDSNDLIEKSRT